MQLENNAKPRDYIIEDLKVEVIRLKISMQKFNNSDDMLAIEKAVNEIKKTSNNEALPAIQQSTNDETESVENEQHEQDNVIIEQRKKKK